MSERQFLWGLSNGVMVFAIAGAFWLGLWIGTAAPRIGGLVCAVSTVLQVGICALSSRADLKVSATAAREEPAPLEKPQSLP